MENYREGSPDTRDAFKVVAFPLQIRQSITPLLPGIGFKHL